MKHLGKWIACALTACCSCSSAGPTTSPAGTSGSAGAAGTPSEISADPTVEFRVTGSTVADESRQRAYASCTIGSSGTFELVGLAGVGAILWADIPQFDLHRIDPFTVLEIGYSPGGDVDPTGAFVSSSDSGCQLTLLQVWNDQLRGNFSCEALYDFSGNVARLWDGDFACAF